MRKSFALRASVIAAIAIASNFAVSAYADGKGDYYIQGAQARFAGSPESAGTVGIAGADIYTRSNSTAVTSNPAGLGMAKDGDVTATYGNDEVSGNDLSTYKRAYDDVNYGQITASAPIVPYLDGPAEYGSLAVGWSGSWQDGDDGLEADTDKQQVHGAYGISVTDDISVGYGLTYTNFDFESDNKAFKYDSDDGFKHSFGVQQKVSDDLLLGYNYQLGFAGGDTKVNGSKIGDSDLTSNTFGVGAEYKLSDETKLVAAIDYTSYDVDGSIVDGKGLALTSGGNEGGDVANYRLGVVQKIMDNLSVSLGYRYTERTWFFGREDLRELNGSAKTGAYTAGLALSIPTGMHYVPAVNVAYGAEYRDIAYGDWLQAVSLSVPFTLCAPM